MCSNVQGVVEGEASAEENEREVAIPLLLLVDFTEVPVPVGPTEYVAFETG